MWAKHSSTGVGYANERSADRIPYACRNLCASGYVIADDHTGAHAGPIRRVATAVELRFAGMG
jgi:hypothetical protein